MFKGVYTALVTPFKDGKVDEDAYVAMIQEQIQKEVDGIVPVGSTGEAPTLTSEEHLRVIGLAVRAADKKIKVIAGTGANSTAEAIYYTVNAEKIGADASLLIAPYYNKPTQEGLFEHFTAISKSTNLPLVLYSIPSRCGIEIGVETVKRLVENCKNIVGIKEAGGDVDRVSQLRAAVKDPNFSILCGDDALTLPFMSVGAAGVVSVASNIIPAELKAMVNAYASGKFNEALEIHQKYYTLFKNLFVETNPVPVKSALAMMKKCHEDLRLPLCPLSQKNRAIVKATLEHLGLIDIEHEEVSW